MSKARAIAIPVTPFIAAAYSLKNATHYLVERMYGTEERTNATMMVALLMTVLGILLQHTAQTTLPAVCSVSAALY